MKSLSRQILLATLCKLLLNIGRRFVYPFAPALSRELDVPLTAITSIIATAQITSLVGFLSGPLAERTGYRFMMRAGLAALTLGMLVCGLVPVYGAIFFGLVMASLGKTLFDPAIQAYVGQHVPYASRARVIGIIELSWAGSTLIGIPLLGLVIEYAGLGSSFYILAAFGLFAWLAVGRVFRVDRPQQASATGVKDLFLSLGRLLRIRPAAGMLAFGFCISLANDNLFVVYGVWFEHDFNISLISLGFSTIAIGTAEFLGESLTAAFSDRLGLKRATIIGLVLATLAYLLLPFAGVTLPLALAAIFLVFCAFEYTMVTSFSLSTEIIPERATMMAGFYAAAGVGRMVGVLLGGILWKSGGITSVAYVSAAMTLLGLIALLWGLKGWCPQQDGR